MIVEIDIFYYGIQHIFKDLIDELKDKKPTNIMEDVFGIDLKLNVSSFDEIICLLEKYNLYIDIKLSIHSDKVIVFISSRETRGCLGNQVE